MDYVPCCGILVDHCAAFSELEIVKKDSPGTPSRKDNRSKTPIIIVPAVTTAVITMYNVKDFLEGVRYISSEEKKRSGVKRQNELILHRKKPHPTQPGQTISIPYRVTDTPLRLSQQEWYGTWAYW